MNKNIYKKIDEAIASKSNSKQTKELLKEVKRELKQAKTEKRAAQLFAVLVRIITGLFD